MKRVTRFLSNCFILLVFMMMLKPQLPLNTKFFSMIYRPINLIEGSIGTNQTWQMFSPNPAKLDSYVIGEVTYEDGSTASYDFNKPLGQNILEKYLFGEKYRKYVGEHLRTDQKVFMWEDGAMFAVRKLAAQNEGKKPVKVTLTRFWHETPDWRQHFLKHSQLKSAYNSYLYYTKELP